MLKFEYVKELVKKKGYGTVQYNNINGETVYISKGICEVFLKDDETQQKLIEMVSRFQKQDYGNSAEYGKTSRPGHEYGRYELEDYADVTEDAGVWVHRTEDAIKVYFKFER